MKQVVQIGEEADPRQFPILRHHHMDPSPCIDMTPIMRDPDSGAYNGAYLWMMYKGPRKLGLHMSPRHNWQITRKYEERGLPTPVAIIVSHHPAFFLGTLNVAPFGDDDYEVIGSVAGESLRLVPSETWGEDFMVPADADIIIEGEIPPNVREVEGPFGEFPGTYGPRRLRWIIDVKAITHRTDAIYQDVFVGHADDWIQGGLPKEARIYNRIKGVVPSVTGGPPADLGRVPPPLQRLDRQEGRRRVEAGGVRRPRRGRHDQARLRGRCRRRRVRRPPSVVGPGHAGPGRPGRGHHQERQGQHARSVADRPDHDDENDHRRHEARAAPVLGADHRAAGGAGPGADRGLRPGIECRTSRAVAGADGRGLRRWPRSST